MPAMPHYDNVTMQVVLHKAGVTKRQSNNVSDDDVGDGYGLRNVDTLKATRTLLNY